MFEMIFEMFGRYYEGYKSESVDYAPYGGGHVKQMSISTFNTYATVVDAPPNQLVKGWVNINAGMPVKALYNPHKRWNGFIQPAFLLPDVDEVIKHYFSDDKVERVNDGFNITSVDGDDYVEPCNTAQVQFENERVSVNSLLGDCCWEVCSTIEAVGLLYLHEIVLHVSMDERLIIDDYNVSLDFQEDYLAQHYSMTKAAYALRMAFEQVFDKGTEERVAKKIQASAYEYAVRFGYSNV